MKFAWYCSLLVAAEMMERREVSIVELMEKQEKMFEVSVTEAQSRTETGGYVLDNTIVGFSLNLTSDLWQQTNSASALDIRAITPSALIHEDPELSSK
ncbi:hypothetical protein MMC34_000103 [Xylographa carneopallida]|nr:hypothetical protein [Xylographa carneopallida]